MRVIVLGGGVVGVTTAYHLQNDGHEVVILERRPGVAEETSFGNAGMIAPGHSFVWSSPKAPGMLLRSLYRRDQPLRFRPSADPRLWSWSLRFLAECTEEKARANTLRKHQLAIYAQQVLRETLAADRLDYDRNTRGILYFHRDQAALDRGAAHMQILADAGQHIEILDRAGVLALEPALADTSAPIAGGIYCPTDETGDCNKFTRALAALIIARGGEIRTGITIQRLIAEGAAISGVVTDHGAVSGDAYVLAMGSQSPFLSRDVGVPLPIYPVKGYSLTIPVGDHAAPPTVASVDEHNRVAITSFGDRVRVTAGAEFAGYGTRHKPSDFAFMKDVVKTLYPNGGDYDRGEMWAGLRPMTPDNLPILGRRRHRNLFYNTGHGHIGWTMSHGTARITADLIGGKSAAVPIAA
jgi:D-amino-acid dehydrogenase